MARLGLTEVKSRLRELTPRQRKSLLYRWSFWARPNQLSPQKDWRIWFVCAGRGAGKTRTGAEWVRQLAEGPPGPPIMLVGPTFSDVRETMIEGESGILAICPPWNRPVYKPSRLMLTWPNGQVARGFSADKPDRMRGPNVRAVWADEWAAWNKPEAFKNLRLCLRKGDPKCLITSTPRSTQEVRQLLKDAENPLKRIHITRASSFENRANLASEWFDLISSLQGTRFGDQEIYGIIHDDVEGALFSQCIIDANRVLSVDVPIRRKVVMMDPAISESSGADEHGIVVAALGVNGHVYILGDYSCKGSPTYWLAALKRARQDHDVHDLVIETNRGGVMTRHTVNNSGQRWRIREIYSTDNKSDRAEPCVPLYDVGRVHHVGAFPQLEEEQTTWVPTETTVSPNRLDACCLAIHNLLPGLYVGKAVTRPEGF